MKIDVQTADLPDTNIKEDDAIEVVARAASHCYRTPISDAKKLLQTLIKRGHMSPFEHANVTAELVTDIGTYKEVTRHRHCAFTIESTHFIKYAEGLNVISAQGVPFEEQLAWFSAIESVHQAALAKYGKLVARKFIPQAQSALVSMTTNIREWFHFFNMRAGKENTPDMSSLCRLIMSAFEGRYPFFMELYYQQCKEHVVRGSEICA